MSFPVQVQLVPITQSDNLGTNAFGTITYSGHPTSNLVVEKSFTIGDKVYTFGGSSVPYNSSTNTMWSSMVDAINSSTGKWSASINTTTQVVTITYNAKGTAGNTIGFSNINVVNVTFSGGGYLSSGSTSSTFPVTKSYDLVVNGQYAIVQLYERIGNSFYLVKDDDPRIGDVSPYTTTDNLPKLRVTFNSDFTGQVAVIGKVGSALNVDERLENIEEALVDLINAADNKFARSQAVQEAELIRSRNDISIDNRLTKLEEKVTKLMNKMGVL